MSFLHILLNTALTVTVSGVVLLKTVLIRPERCIYFFKEVKTAETVELLISFLF
jgi:hypothetical protein